MNKVTKKIHHSAITVKSLDESVQFYQDFLGFEKLVERDISVDQEGYFKGIKIKVA